MSNTVDYLSDPNVCSAYRKGCCIYCRNNEGRTIPFSKRFSDLLSILTDEERWGWNKNISRIRTLCSIYNFPSTCDIWVLQANLRDWFIISYYVSEHRIDVCICAESDTLYLVTNNDLDDKKSWEYPFNYRTVVQVFDGIADAIECSRDYECFTDSAVEATHWNCFCKSLYEHISMRLASCATELFRYAVEQENK